MVVPREEVQLPLDPGGFSGRVCPRCHARFKVRHGRRAARDLAAALVARVAHLNASEAGAPQLRHCPYCGARTEAEAWWTDQQRRWIDARAAALRAELDWRRLRMPLERLGDNPRPTYLPVLPRRRVPVSVGEEAEVMAAVPLPCCGEEVLVARVWSGAVRCHWCGWVHARSATRDIGAELAQLRDWTAVP